MLPDLLHAEGSMVYHGMALPCASASWRAVYGMQAVLASRPDRGEFVSEPCGLRTRRNLGLHPLERFSARTLPARALSCLLRPLPTRSSSTARLGLPHAFCNSARSTARGRVRRAYALGRR